MRSQLTARLKAAFKAWNMKFTLVGEQFFNLLTMNKLTAPAVKRLLSSQSWPENVLGLKAYLRSLNVASYREVLADRERTE
jgi:hypothetical protein